jgi:hypothetical protein
MLEQDEPLVAYHLADFCRGFRLANPSANSTWLVGIMVLCRNQAGKVRIAETSGSDSRRANDQQKKWAG